jgi:DNA-binding NarL/FixJ family response regulator
VRLSWGAVASKVVSGFLRKFEQRRREPPGTLSKPDDLSEREREVLKLVANGVSNKEIASRLYITEGTAKNHVSSILRKLGMRDRTQLVLYAAQRGREERG